MRPGERIPKHRPIYKCFCQRGESGWRKGRMKPTTSEGMIPRTGGLEGRATYERDESGKAEPAKREPAKREQEKRGRAKRDPADRPRGTEGSGGPGGHRVGKGFCLNFWSSQNP